LSLVPCKNVLAHGATNNSKEWPQRVLAGHHTPSAPYPPTGHNTTPFQYRASSIPPSPYAGLTEGQIKRLQKAFEKMDSMVEFSRELLELAGVSMSKEDVISIVGQWAEKRPDVRTFSKLTTQDYNILCKAIHNVININDGLLLQQIPDNVIPLPFLPMLRMTRLVSARSTEMGTRKIINIFLDTAVYIARMVFAEERLVVDHEYETEPTDVPEIGVVGGPLDYVTARAAGKIDMGTCLNILLLIRDRNTHGGARWSERVYRKALHDRG
jgi:hypothetical protein